MSNKTYVPYKDNKPKTNSTKTPGTIIPPPPKQQTYNPTPDEQQEAFNFFFPETKAEPYGNFPSADYSPYPVEVKKEKPAKKDSNFIKVDVREPYYQLEHKVSKERKWIHKKYFNDSKLSEVFYDQDPRFSPPTTSKKDPKW